MSDAVIFGIALAAAGAILTAALASGHAILYKRDVKAAIGWAGFIWIAPYAGPLFYLLFGVNRIRRRATRLRPGALRAKRLASLTGDGSGPELPVGASHLDTLIRLGDRVCRNRVQAGNSVRVLDGGPIAFAEMLESFRASTRSIRISTYIFEHDATGRRLIEVLGEAVARGVEVRVLMDAVGSRDGSDDVISALEALGVRVARFLPPGVPGILSVNLRNHRKLVLVDGAIAFTGGMNIADEYSGLGEPEMRIRDVHFAVEGPVVAGLEETFATDWSFTTGESLSVSPVDGEARGAIGARVVADGPDEDFELCRWLIQGALAVARHRIRIVTPYFLPDGALITALNVAALRGVLVEIHIPEQLDHPPVKWATTALLWQVLDRGCRVFMTPPPFDHAKMFTIDGVWALFGSSNWDARSLRLNFELNVEAYGAELAGKIDTLIDDRRACGREITLAEVDARPIPVRLRDGFARLFIPFL